jgi:hypothetical protein
VLTRRLSPSTAQVIGPCPTSSLLTRGVGEIVPSHSIGPGARAENSITPPDMLPIGVAMSEMNIT